jgi:hypothetical protein
MFICINKLLIIYYYYISINIIVIFVSHIGFLNVEQFYIYYSIIVVSYIIESF